MFKSFRLYIKRVLPGFKADSFAAAAALRVRIVSLVFHLLEEDKGLKFSSVD